MDSDGNSDISESELFFDSVDNLDKAATSLPDTRLQQQQHDREQDDDMPLRQPRRPSSYTSSISDVSDFARPTSMQESFVGLNYSTSAESDPCQHIPSNFGDIDDWSNGINTSAELQDPNKFEGRSHQHNSILLLKTRTPLWVPLTQV